MKRLRPSHPSASVALPRALRLIARRLGVRAPRFLLLVDIRTQRMELARLAHGLDRTHAPRAQSFRISTSRFGIGQVAHSNRTPLGLHRIARKIGGGLPWGAVFKSRKLIGYTWEGLANAAIVHRILWLEGLQPGFNRGGNVDTFQRYVYIHGTGDETTLGRPASHGCVHVRGTELLPLYDLLPPGTLVWISRDLGAEG